ncbi:hypothetical protein KI387_013787, partial [Taxus chinensis]
SRTRPARWSWKCGTSRPFWIIGPTLLALWHGNPLPPLLGVYVREDVVVEASQLTVLTIIALPGGNPSIGGALSTTVVGGPCIDPRNTVAGAPATTPRLLRSGMGGFWQSPPVGSCHFS